MVDHERWDAVGRQFNDLGRKVRERYEQTAGEAGPDEERVRDALRVLTDALDRAFTAVGEAVRDPVFREDVGKAATSLGTALGEVVSDLGDDISRRFPRGP